MSREEHSLTQPKRVERTYTEEDVERGLTVLAFMADSRSASDETGIPAGTLRHWRRVTHAERFERIRAQLLPRIQAKLAIEAEDLATRYAELEHETIAQFDATKLKPGEMAGAMRNLATSRAISIDKAQLLRGNPTQIVEKRSGQEIVDSLAKRFPHLVGDVEGTAEEIEDAQLAG